MPALGFGILIPDAAATISASRDALEAGCRLFDCAHRCCPAGGKAIGDNGGVTKRAEVAALIEGAIDNFGRVDVIVNDADIMPIAQIDALKVEEWDRQIDVNIKGEPADHVANQLVKRGDSKCLKKSVPRRQPRSR